MSFPEPTETCFRLTLYNFGTSYTEIGCFPIFKHWSANLRVCIYWGLYGMVNLQVIQIIYIQSGQFLFLSLLCNIFHGIVYTRDYRLHLYNSTCIKRPKRYTGSLREFLIFILKSDSPLNSSFLYGKFSRTLHITR